MAVVTVLALSGENQAAMPAWALSGAPIVYRQLDGSSGAVLGAALVAALDAAGWAQTATLASGVTLEATSPQSALGLTVSLDVVWASASVSLQLHSTATGCLHGLGCAAGRTFQIVAGPCQFFVSQPATAGPTSYGSNVCGGIPYIAPTDPLYPDGPLPDECWWSVGDSGNYPYGSNTPRNVLGYADAYSAMTGGWCGYFHRPGEPTTHALVTEGQGVAWMCIELAFQAAGLVTQMLYPNMEPFLYEPLLAWGDYCSAGAPYTNYPPKVRGELWDAFIASGPQIGDAGAGAGKDDLVRMAYDGSLWINYSMGLPLANLYLLLTAGAPFGNVAY